MFKMTSFDDLSRQVWAAKDLDAKKALLMQMTEQFRVKGKKGVHIQTFQAEIRVAECPKVLDQMAANLALNINDKVVRIA